MKRLLKSLGAGGCLLLASCTVIPPPQSDATRFYVLSEVPRAGGGAGEGAGTLRVGLRNVEVASYLASRDIVVRNGSNEVVLNDYARWAEPLDAALTRVVRARLQASPSVGEVYAQPFPFEADRDYDVSIDVLDFEGVAGRGGSGMAVLTASIDISTAGARRHLARHELFTAPAIAWDGKDYAPLAAALSDQAGALAAEVESLLKELPRPATPSR
jgi:uncharacterized lipoprotein YmbA